MDDEAMIAAVLEDQLKRTKAYACLDCGKCTSVCPVSYFSREYSPRILLNRTVRKNFNGLLEGYDLWSCLTCKKCDQVCPSGIDYIGLTQFLRTNARTQGFTG